MQIIENKLAHILHIDTSGSRGCCFISNDGKVIAQQYIDDAHSQSSLINQTINELVHKAKISIIDLEAIAVCNGPGSYTGLRVGLATAKGICFALDKNLILNNKLALALSEFKNSYTDFIIAFKARKEEYFIISDKDEKAQHILLNDLIEKAQRLGITSIITDDEDFSNEQFTIHHIAIYEPNQENWGKIALKLLNAKKFDDIAYAEPFYLKQAFTTQAKNNILQP